jgi:hypothetical protein
VPLFLFAAVPLPYLPSCSLSGHLCSGRLGSCARPSSSLILNISHRLPPRRRLHSPPTSSQNLPAPNPSRRHCFPDLSLAAPPGAMQASLPSWKDGEKKQQIQIPWKSLQLLVPHRLRRRLRSKLRNRNSPASSISALKTSFSPADTLRSLQNHRWTIYDGQWLLLAVVGIFSLSIIESPGPLVKTMVATLILSSFIFPITRQFIRPFTPIASYLIFFYACR